ncbi:hypothetical protein ACXYL9_11745 [Qipengyuania sp. CAU 1752]
MKTKIFLPLLALGLAAAPAASVLAQSPGTFSLPPNPTPTPTPRVQGPVDDTGVVPRGPRVIPTASPTPAPTATPTPTPTPTPTETQRPRPTATSTIPAPRPGIAAPTPAPSPVRPTPAATASPSEPRDEGSRPAPGQPDAPTATDPLPFPQNTAAPTEAATDILDEGESIGWGWIIALLAVLGIAIAAFVSWRRRFGSVEAPQIVKPVVAPSGPATGAGAAALDDPMRFLKIELEPVRMSRSMMATTLTYRLTLSNRADVAMRGIVIAGDLTSAHGRAPIAEQMADGTTMLPDIHTLEHLGPGQSKILGGDIRLPLKDVRPIHQGNVPIIVPLARIKLAVAGGDPTPFTFVIGKRPAQLGGRLQPFRLDTPPQTYQDIDSRPLT